MTTSALLCGITGGVLGVCLFVVVCPGLSLLWSVPFGIAYGALWAVLERTD